MNTTPARPYTEADVHAEAVLLGIALSRPPSVTDLERSLPGQYIPSRRADDGTSPTYGDLLDADSITALARAVHDRITGGAVRAAADRDLTQAREELEDANGEIAEMQRDIAHLRKEAAEANATKEKFIRAFDTVTSLRSAERAQPAEVRAAALTEFADRLVAYCPADGKHDKGYIACYCPIADAMRREAAAARPETEAHPAELTGPPPNSPESIADEIFRKLGPPAAARPDDTTGA